jgi:DNA-binding transcriptional MerR regulator
MSTPNYKIGQVASRMGISVRTLHLYDEIGLLTPACRASSGHRLYTDRELTRLQKIVALRRMGFSLSHVRTVLSGDTAAAFRTLEGQADRLRRQISQQQEILRRVEAVLDLGKVRRRFTKTEREQVTKRSADLRAALALEMERGTDPKATRVQELTQQLEQLGKELVGGLKRGMFLERFIAFRHNTHLPQDGRRHVDEMRKRFQEMRLFEYLWRVRA